MTQLDSKTVATFTLHKQNISFISQRVIVKNSNAVAADDRRADKERF